MSRDALWTPQPLPVPGKELIKKHIGRLLGEMYRDIFHDCVAKMEASEKKYGSPLMSDNGRDADLDAYTDLVDTVNYTVQKYLEEKDPDERTEINIQLNRLLHSARWLRYRLVRKGTLPNE